MKKINQILLITATIFTIGTTVMQCYNLDHEIEKVINKLNAEYQEWEATNPQQGYCITISTKEKNALKGEISPYGGMRTTSLLSGIPTDTTKYLEHCPFCAFKEKNRIDKKILKDFHDGTYAITSLNHQILIIPAEHYDHFFVTPFHIQVNIIKNALSFRNSENTTLKRPLEFHCGAAAGQTVFHLHARTGCYTK